MSGSLASWVGVTGRRGDLVLAGGHQAGGGGGFGVLFDAHADLRAGPPQHAERLDHRLGGQEREADDEVEAAGTPGGECFGVRPDRIGVEQQGAGSVAEIVRGFGGLDPSPAPFEERHPEVALKGS
jgi:hypothetical protein